MRNTNLLSDLLKSGLAGITLISEENWWQFFLSIALRCLANHKNGTFTDIQKCILDFDKKSGYFLFCLVYIRNFKPLASFCGCAGRVVSSLVANPEDRFFRDEAEMVMSKDLMIKLK